MAARCSISGKRPLTGNLVSHANNKTKTRQMPNLQWKRIYVPELNKHFRLKISCYAIRCIDKMGLLNYLKKKKLTLKDVCKNS